jgi:hypothetical protein
LGVSKFPGTPISLILLRKINEIGVPGKYFLAAKAAKGLARGLFRLKLYQARVILSRYCSPSFLRTRAVASAEGSE